MSNPAIASLTWTPVANAEIYEFQISYDAGVTWEPLYGIPATDTASYSFYVTPGTGVYFRVTGDAGSTWQTLGPYNLTSILDTPVRPSSVSCTLALDFLSASWSSAPLAYSYRAEVWVESAHGSGTFNTLVLTSTTFGTSYTWNADDIVGGGGPWDRVEVRIYSLGRDGTPSPDYVSEQCLQVLSGMQTAFDSATPGGPGDVVGPASVTDDLPAVFDGTSGKLLKSKTYALFKTALSLVKGDVGLGNVDNTSDVNKPVSTAQATAIALKADIASPTFTGTPAAPTAAAGTNTTQLATTGFVKAAIDVVLGGVSSTYDTLVELATGKADLASPTFTGTPAAPTATKTTNTTQLATTAFVQTLVKTSVRGGTFNLTTASGGTVDITGFGFDPRSAELLACVAGSPGHCHGFASSDGTQRSVNIATDGLTPYTQNAQILIYTNSTVTVYQQGTLTFITDGVRITFAKVGAPTGSLEIQVLGRS